VAESIEIAEKAVLLIESVDFGDSYNLSKEKPDVLSMVKSRFAAWEKRMAEAEPRGPFRNF
jgi:arylsulfatase A